jgi:hypothetical protein
MNSYPRLEKKGPQSATSFSGANPAVQVGWPDIFSTMKIGGFDQNTALRRTLIRGVACIVNRLAPGTNSSIEALSSLKELEDAIQSGEITDSRSLPGALRTIIRRRNRDRSASAVPQPSVPVPNGLTVALSRMSSLQRAIASLYYVELLSQEEICAKLSIDSSQVTSALDEIRRCARLHTATEEVRSTGLTAIAV